jgi:hypothetical protein
VPEDEFSADGALSKQLPIAPILALHRHDDGYIAFAVARDGGDDFRPLISIRRDELARYFPEFREQLLKDSYVSINAGWRLRRQGSDRAAYGYPLHRADRLRYLCAAYADLDYYRLGVDFGQALGQIVTMQETGYLPRASIIVKSGRGMWLLYLLHDQRDPSRAPGAFPEKLAQYFRLQKAIVERLAIVGADPSARDAARHIRVPGSLHTGAEDTVKWWIQGEGAAAYSYSLTQLCQLFGVQPAKRHVRERAAIEEPEKEKHRRGWVALSKRRLREFSLLRSMRGGFPKGCRNNAAMLYAWLLRTNGVSRHEAAVEVNLMGAECRPPLTLSECRGAVKTGFGPRMVRMLDQTISDRLNVTPGEAAMLEGLGPATTFKPKDPAPPAPMPSEIQARTIMERRGRITEVVAELGLVPSVREMGKRLIKAGFRGNHQTVFKDYRALGIKSDRTHAARAELKSRQLLLSDC